MTAPTARPRLRVGPGPALPLGAHPVADGIRFSVAAPAAERLHLVLLDPTDGSVRHEVPFPAEHRAGDVFSMVVSGLGPGPVHYGLRAFPPGADPQEAEPPVLLDPYATTLAGAETWGRRRRRRSVVQPPEPFDWQGDRLPQHPEEQLVVYELHVRGFTRHPSSGTEAPGTFEALRRKIPYLRDLGVTCVELMPVFEFDETDNTFTEPATGRPLPNYWGYNPLSYFAPKASYAARPDRVHHEFKLLVRDLHHAGIEVLLDVVFNHTAEGDHRGPDHSWRRLAGGGAYLMDEHGRHLNLTATGNTVNANHPYMRTVILDALRHWATEYHVDGFRFDMAAILARGTDGRPLDDPPLLEAIAHDPVLAGRRLIAEATDASGLDLVGRFPHHGRWAEWNDRYRDTVRRFLTGRPGAAADLATRLAGSPDLYAARGPAASVNYVTCHDGFTLADWSSYDRPHNERNGEQGQDGITANDSWNCGHEGPTGNPAVHRLRARQVKTALLLLLMSRGIPMLTAGDECGRTQLGNNNAYSQDNEISWFDWDLVERHRDLHRFTRLCIAFRRAHPAVHRMRHPTGPTPPGWSLPPMSRHGVRPGRPDRSPHSPLTAVMLHDEDGGPAAGHDTVFLAANRGGDTLPLIPPRPPAGTRWALFADTARTSPADAHPPGREPVLGNAGLLRLAPHSAVVLVATTPEKS
ncbi:glycogen debranching protein [Streptomyces hoynatensis]|uniref:Glycogen-debranching protein n=1 Tax=Streptomyces hoynatensis TaxID=1141874 RepID=A0A3A9YNP2_9ACTN|nr:isoamylase [Streptomyces hoynatensis]RKN36697.1 glycogen-debranching protein [Streptomyces hoynatensis]